MPNSCSVSRAIRNAFLGIVLILGAALPLFAQGPAEDVPWWKQQKINFMWGTWGLSNHDPGAAGVTGWQRPVPRKTFRNAALAGTTVFADLWQYKPAHARMAKEHGMRYFSSPHLHHMKWMPGGRIYISEKGVQEHGRHTTAKWPFQCPLDESLWERWIANKSVRDGIREGIVDGIHTDWEDPQAGIGVCYCDWCFSEFLKRQGIEAELPAKTERHAWLKARELDKVYADPAAFSQRRFEMFARMRKKLQALNPRLMFSSYGTAFSDFTRAMHTPEVPYMFLDSRHYCNDDRQAWWESYSWRLKKEGYLYICGGWTNALFGAQVSQVSATRWIYDAMINEDGVWQWFAHELTDEVFTAYASADRRVRAVEGVVGDFLQNGRRDPSFVTTVEWTGNPQLERATVHRAYHLGDRHLAHVNNVAADWPLRVRLRLPRLPEGAWTVQDPMGGACYTHDGKSAVWSSAQLKAGVVVSMDARSDLFVLISPADGAPAAAEARLIHSREFDTMYSHQEAAAQVTIETSKTLSKSGWRFRMAKEDSGMSGKWFTPDTSVEGWVSIDIEEFWGNKGGTGAGWYRRDVRIPALPDDKRIYLHFGAVDEELMLWIDGEYVGQHDRGPNGWNKPFAMDVTGKLTAGRRHLALRVWNSAAAGGVWKPIGILAAPATDGETTGSVAYDETLDALLSKADTIAIPFTPESDNVMVITAARQMLSEGSGGPRCFVNNAIEIADAGGAESSQLRHLRGHLWSPSYSPDGSRIVFAHDAGGRGQINVMNADGTGAVNVSGNAFCDRVPVWSPDGGRLAFLSDREGDWDIYVMNADGTGQRRLAGNPGLDRAPAWSPDGKTIAWESHVSGTPSIWVCNADGTDSRPLIAPDRPLTVQEGKSGKDGVFNFPDVGWPFADNTVYLSDPIWSPDGKRIAAVGIGEYSGDMVVLLDADGSRMLKLIRWIASARDLAWSPDGTYLAGACRTAPQETDHSGIFVVRTDGKDENRCGRFLVDVSPTGPRLGTAIRMGAPTWYSHGSGRPRRVLKTFTSLAWSPDGKTLAFSSDMDPSGAFHVYTIPAKGGETTRLDATKSAWVNDIMWRPSPSRADRQ